MYLQNVYTGRVYLSYMAYCISEDVSRMVYIFQVNFIDINLMFGGKYGNSACEPLGKWTRHLINLTSPCLWKEKSPEYSARIEVTISVTIAMSVEVGDLFKLIHF